MDQPIEDGLEERAPVAFDSSDSDYEAEEPSYGAAEEGKLPARRLRPFAWSWRKFAAFAGPGWLMSLAYLVEAGAIPQNVTAAARRGEAHRRDERRQAPQRGHLKAASCRISGSPCLAGFPCGTFTSSSTSCRCLTERELPVWACSLSLCSLCRRSSRSTLNAARHH